MPRKARILQLNFDPKRKPAMLIAVAESEQTDPWGDMGVVMEGVGALAAICRNMGIEHKDKTMSAYLHDYLDLVLADYNASHMADGASEEA